MDHRHFGYNKKKKKEALKCLLNPNSKFQSLTTQFLSAKGEHRAISANQIAILLPSLPPVTVGLRVAQRPLQIRYGGRLVRGSSYGPEGPTSLFLHVALCPRDPTKVPTFGWGRWRPGVSCSDTCVSLMSHKGQNLRDTYLLGEIPSRYLVSVPTYLLWTIPPSHRRWLDG